jgi:hypothetical protein
MIDAVCLRAQHQSTRHEDAEWAAWYSSVPDSTPGYRALSQILSFAYDKAERAKLMESLVQLGARQACLLAAAVKDTSLGSSAFLRSSDMSLPLTSEHTLHRTLGAASVPELNEVCFVRMIRIRMAQ